MELRTTLLSHFAYKARPLLDHLAIAYKLTHIGHLAGCSKPYLSCSCNHELEVTHFISMELITKIAWALLALIHLTPGLVMVRPSMIERLYGIAPSGDIGLLLIHRGALFLTVAAACFFAMIEPGLRRAMACLVAISVIGFLITYVRGGMPLSLRPIAIADMIALLLLVFIAWRAWQA